MSFFLNSIKSIRLALLKLRPYFIVVLMGSKQSIELKLEIERVSLIYRQNSLGVLALLLFSSTYAFLCGNLLGNDSLTIWIFLVLLSSTLRIGASYLWNKKRFELTKLREINAWHLFLQAMILVSGIIWGYAGWLGAQSPDPTQQIITAITVIFMCAGAIVCWAPSMKNMFSFIIPAIVPWALSYVLKEDLTSQIIGSIGLVYVVIGCRAGIILNRYIDRSLRLNIENSELAKDLQQEIFVKDRAEEALRIALSSSDAIEWRWNVESDSFICKGDLSRSLGIKSTYISGNLDQIAQIFYPDDQQKFRVMILSLALKGGELDTELRVSWPNGEIHDLALRGKAQNSFEGKITHLTGIAWDTTAQRSQSRLQKEKDIHEAANKAKSVFLANASHEIRTPLAAINGYVESLLQNDLPPEEIKSDLEIISRNGKFLASLVNDFLDLSKIESGRFYMQKGLISPIHEIEESLDLIKPSLEEKGIALKVIYESQLPSRIESDSGRFRQIMANLLSNAVKYSENGKITVRIKHSITNLAEGSLSIKVTDTGIGMDDKTKSQIFEPFVRGHTIEVQRVSGSGLGLALSKNLALILGGDLKLNSSILGEGSEFEFTLNTGLIENLIFPNKKSSVSKTKKLKDLKILVVDDVIDLRVLMKRHLERQGAFVLTSEDGRDAVAKALEHKPDVILMDIKMPIMDGYDATASIRRQGFTAPIIAITAHASTDDKNKCLEVGCNYYLSKPVDFSFLVETIVRSQNINIDPTREHAEQL